MVWTGLYRWKYWIKDVEDGGARKAVGGTTYLHRLPHLLQGTAIRPNDCKHEFGLRT